MSMTAGNDLIPVGRISGTHGVRGQLKLHSYSGNLQSLKTVGSIVLRAPNGTLRTETICQARDHSGKILITLAGLQDINHVLELVGYEVCLSREQFPPTEDDEYYWQDLLGLQVITDNGITLGHIHDILETGANDVYLVKNEQTGQEYLIPAIADVVASIDLATGIMTITPLEGLLEL